MGEKASFIVLEGIDGSGKTTQANLLREYFQKQGLPVKQTREPGGTPIGEEVRSVLLKDRGSLMDPVTQTILFYAARREFMTQVVSPALESGVNVIADRFEPSTYVYQGLVQGVPLHLLDALRRYAVEDIQGGTVCRPDLVLVLDITAKEGLRRMRNKDRVNQSTIYEKQGREFLEKVRMGYQNYVTAFQYAQGGYYHTWTFLLDGMKSEQEVHQEVVSCVEKIRLEKV